MEIADLFIAKTVSTNIYKTQNLIFTLHGDKSKTKKKLKPYEVSFDNELERYVEMGKTVVINGSKNKSYWLDGLNKNTIVFKSKVNHIMIRGCDDTRIYLNGGTISGIDILKGSNVSVRTPKHNYTNVEISNNTTLGGTIDNNSLIHVTNSMDVIVNHKNLHVNPFIKAELKLVYTTDDNQERLDIGELSSSPTDTKLYMIPNN